jgi:exocyst complex component 8
MIYIYSYAEFVVISKEISVLENEMLELKESLAEWKGMPSLLHIDESASAAGMFPTKASMTLHLRIICV